MHKHQHEYSSVHTDMTVQLAAALANCYHEQTTLDTRVAYNWPKLYVVPCKTCAPSLAALLCLPGPVSNTPARTAPSCTYNDSQPTTRYLRAGLSLLPTAQCSHQGTLDQRVQTALLACMVCHAQTNAVPAVASWTLHLHPFRHQRCPLLAISTHLLAGAH